MFAKETGFTGETKSTEGTQFTEDWNALPLRDRRRLRRMVRIGRLPDDADEARLARGFAAHEQLRLWWRGFWFWFVPGLIVALAVATMIHPLVIGIVLASGAQALVVRRNAGRIARQTPAGASTA